MPEEGRIFCLQQFQGFQGGGGFRKSFGFTPTPGQFPALMENGAFKTLVMFCAFGRDQLILGGGIGCGLKPLLQGPFGILKARRGFKVFEFL